LSDSGISEFTGSWPALITLDLSGCKNLVEFAPDAPQLQELNLRGTRIKSIRELEMSQYPQLAYAADNTSEYILKVIRIGGISIELESTGFRDWSELYLKLSKMGVRDKLPPKEKNTKQQI